MVTDELKATLETLKQLPRGEIEALAIAYVRSHAAACDLLGIEKPNHIDDLKVVQRIESMSNEQLAAMLAPPAVAGRIAGSASS
jgi:hypothetical protein